MGSLKRKLNNENGVTILIALVGFMVAAMVSIVIISAAVTSTQRVANDKTTTQAQLTLESAAQLLRDKILDTTCMVTKDSENYSVEASSQAAPGTEPEFAAELEDAVAYVDDSDSAGQPYDSSKENTGFTISLTLDSAADPDSKLQEVKDVEVSFVMKNSPEKYDLTFTLTLKGSEQAVYLSMVGKATTAITKNGKTTYTVSWLQQSINELGAS